MRRTCGSLTVCVPGWAAGAFLTLFGLLFWDVLFAPLPGAFTSPYQSAPHDLHSRHFADRRAGKRGGAPDGRLRRVHSSVDA